MKRRTQSSSNVISFVLAMTFGLLALVVVYAAFKGGSTQLQSRAAIENVILKQWNFDVASAGGTWQTNDGWQNKGFAFVTKARGALQLTVNPKVLTPQIINNQVFTFLKYPTNKFRIRISVNNTTRPSATPASWATNFTINVAPKYKGSTVFDRGQSIYAVADGTEHEYFLEFPSGSSLKSVDALIVQFASLPVQPKMVVSISDIALIGVTNGQAICLSYDLNNDGMVDSSDTDIWKQNYGLQSSQWTNKKVDINKDGMLNASDYTLIVNHLNETTGKCIPAETASTPTPTPPSGCVYRKVQCITAPCDSVLYCPQKSISPMVPPPVNGGSKNGPIEGGG